MDDWSRVDALVNTARSLAELHQHRVHLYAAWRWRTLGRQVPPELLALERAASVVRMGLHALVARMRAAYDGPIVLLKGADVAALYPRPELRPSQDLDVLVPDAESVHRALLDAGFVEDVAALPDDHHHLQPLTWPGLPGCIEIHSTPNWPVWLSPPSPSELFDAAIEPSRAGHGVMALSETHRTLVLLAHLWRDDPMRRLGQLLDVVLAEREADSNELARTARRWEMEGLWRKTNEITESLLSDGGRGSGRGAWLLTRPLDPLRERSTLESRIVEIAAPYYGLPLPKAARASGSALTAWVRPRQGETWARKARRTGRLVPRLFAPMSSVNRQRELEQRRSNERT